MATKLRMPTLAFAALSICLNLAIIGCAGQTINFFVTEQKINVWLLPIWPNHFDTRELQALIGTSAAILVLNVVLAISLFVKKLPANVIVLATSILSVVCSLIAIIFPTIVNGQAPGRDTLQTWTCRWSSTSINRGQGPPSGFDTICHETRFAFYTTIPVFILQLLLLFLALYTLATARSSTRERGVVSDVEKSQSQHELGEVRNHSFDTKNSGSPQSRQEGVMGAKGVSFA
ncbi:hypothetical protein LTR78_009115 [Recurvomyces mirabilis]|uniref:Uncharacterized protein n=1 Tax=Recurvomyces mirabilis TaxID=574656 RepID=A0AAE0TSV2_9PEZI|nr:hypothetical protein LTR78_009115 [Recurvomyces mirabilis]KAK5161053.1 hypothetical protein LTS14_000848 [Recurvomyces mirabilis]